MVLGSSFSSGNDSMPIHPPLIQKYVRDLRFSNPQSFCDVSLSQYPIERKVKFEGKPPFEKDLICGHLATYNETQDVADLIKLGNL
jgi:hypothetical protein